MRTLVGVCNLRDQAKRGYSCGLVSLKGDVLRKRKRKRKKKSRGLSYIRV